MQFNQKRQSFAILYKPHKKQNAKPQDQYQTVKEVADRPKVAEATVRHWIKVVQLRAIDIGKVKRIATADLNEFLRLL